MKKAADKGHLAAKYWIGFQQYQYRFFDSFIRENGWKIMLEVFESEDKYFLTDFQGFQFAKPLDQGYRWEEYCPHFGALNNLKNTCWYKIVEIGETQPVWENKDLLQRKVFVSQKVTRRISCELNDETFKFTVYLKRENSCSKLFLLKFLKTLVLVIVNYSFFPNDLHKLPNYNCYYLDETLNEWKFNDWENDPSIYDQSDTEYKYIDDDIHEDEYPSTNEEDSSSF